jgi:hypothetical protein
MKRKRWLLQFSELVDKHPELSTDDLYEKIPELNNDESLLRQAINFHLRSQSGVEDRDLAKDFPDLFEDLQPIEKLIKKNVPGEEKNTLLLNSSREYFSLKDKKEAWDKEHKARMDASSGRLYNPDATEEKNPFDAEMSNVEKRVNDLGYNSKEVFDLAGSLPKGLIFDFDELLHEKAANPYSFNRRKAAIKWQGALYNAISQKEGGVVASRMLSDLLNHEFVNDYKSQKVGTSEAVSLVHQYVDSNDEQEGIIQEIAKDKAYGYGINLPGTKEDYAEDSRSSVLNRNQKIGLDYLEAVDPASASSFNRLLSLTPEEIAAQKDSNSFARGYQIKARELENIGLGLQQRAFEEKLTTLQKKNEKNELSTNDIEEYKKIYDQYEQIQQYRYTQKNRYPEVAVMDADKAMQEALGARNSVGKKFILGVGNEVDDVMNWIGDVVTTPFESDSHSKVSDLELLGDKEFTQNILRYTPEKDRLLGSEFTIKFDDPLNNQIREIQNLKNLTDDDKQSQIRDLILHNQEKISYIPNDRSGKLNFTAKALLNTTADVGSQLIPQLAIAYMTAGGNATKLRELTSLFGSTFATTYNDYYADAIRQNIPHPSTYALVNSTIEASSELLNNDFEMARRVTGKESILGSILRNTSREKWDAIKGTKKGLFRKSIDALTATGRVAFINAAKETGEEVAGQLGSNVAKDQIFGIDTPLMEDVKPTIVNTFLGMLPLGLLSLPFQYKNIGRNQRYAFYEAGLNPQIYMSATDDDVKNGIINSAEGEIRKKAIGKAAEIVTAASAVRADGSILSDNQKADLVFNLFVKHETEKLKQSVPQTVNEKLDEVATGLDAQNSEILETKEEKRAALVDKLKNEFIENLNNDANEESDINNSGVTGSQEEAASVNPQTNFPQPKRPIHELTSAELFDYALQIKEYDKHLLARLFGEEGAKKYKEAQSVSNSSFSSSENRKQADKTISGMEATLSEEQQNELFGINDSAQYYDHSEIRDIAGKVRLVEDSENLDELSHSLKLPLIEFARNQKSIEALAILNAAKNRATELGADPKELLAQSFKRIADDLPDHADAEFLLSDIFGKLLVPESVAPSAAGLADRIRSYKVKPTEFYGGFLGLGVAVYNGMLESAATIISAGGSITEALKAAVNYVKSNLGQKKIADQSIKSAIENEFVKKGWMQTNPSFTKAINFSKKKLDEGVNEEAIREALKSTLGIDDDMALNLIANAKNKNIPNLKTPKEKHKVDFSDAEVQAVLQKTSKSIWERSKAFAVKKINKYFTSSLGLPSWVLELKDYVTGNINAEVRKAEHLVALLRKEIKETGFTDFNAIDAAMRSFKESRDASSNEYLAALPESMQVIVSNMRDFIDGLSRDLVVQGYVTPDQAVTLQENMGEYLHRAYRLQNSKKWIDKIPQTVKEEAIRFLLQDSYSKVVATHPELSEQEARSQAQTMAESSLRSILESVDEIHGIKTVQGSKDEGILKQREDVPEPIRQLLGEYKDPGISFVMTIAKLASYKANSEFLNKLRQQGMGVLFFDKNDPKRPPEYSQEFVPEGSRVWSPLSGLYTKPEYKEAFQEAELNLGKIWAAYQKLIGAVRWGKTVLSPVTQIKNFIGNTFFAVMNGHYRVANFGKSWQYFRTVITNGTHAGTAEDLVDKLVRLRLLDQGVNISEMKKMLKDDKLNKLVVSLAPEGNKILLGLKSIYDYLNNIYGGSDNFWKCYAWLNESQIAAKAFYHKSYTDLSEPEQKHIDEFSAQRIKDTYPTYSRVVKAAKGLSSNVPLLGNFLSFQAESIRVLYNTFHYAIGDIKSGDEARKRIGLQKLVTGIIPYIGGRTVFLYGMGQIAGIGASGILHWLNDDDEDQKRKDVNRFVPGFTRSGDKLLVKEGPGKYSVINLSDIDPYAYSFKVLNALTEGNENIKDPGITAAIDELLNPYIEKEMLFASLLQVDANKDDFGKKIYNTDDPLGTKFIKGFKHVKDKLQPSVIGLADRLINDEDKERELFGLVGLKGYEVNPEKQFVFKLKAGSDIIQDVRKQFNSLKFKAEMSEDEKITKEVELEKRITAAVLSLHEDYAASTRLGVDPIKLNAILDPKKALQGFTKDIKQAIKTGVVLKGGFLKVEKLKKQVVTY